MGKAAFESSQQDASDKNIGQVRGQVKLGSKVKLGPFRFGCQLPAAEAALWAVRCYNVFKYCSYPSTSKIYNEIKVKVKVILRSFKVTLSKTD